MAPYGKSDPHLFFLEYLIKAKNSFFSGKCVDATGKLQSAFYIGACAGFTSFFFCLIMRHFYLKKFKTEKKQTTDCIS